MWLILATFITTARELTGMGVQDYMNGKLLHMLKQQHPLAWLTNKDMGIWMGQCRNWTSNFH